MQDKKRSATLISCESMGIKLRSLLLGGTVTESCEEVFSRVIGQYLPWRGHALIREVLLKFF